MELTSATNQNLSQCDSDLESALPLQPPQQPRMDPDQNDPRSSSGSESSPESEKIETDNQLAVKGFEIHDDIKCYKCGMDPIVGPRYTHYNLWDYCQGCKDASKHSHHGFKRKNRVRGTYTAAMREWKRKQRLTYICTKSTWRLIQLGISLWQIGDMVSDAFQTRKFYHLAMVRNKFIIILYFVMQQLTIPTVHARGKRI